MATHKLVYRRGARGQVAHGTMMDIRTHAAKLLRNIRRSGRITITRSERSAWMFAEAGRHVGSLEIQRA